MAEELTGKKRQRYRRRAHALGLTLAGYAYKRGGGESILAERTGRSIRKQAQREIDSAYAPVEKEYGRQETEARSLDAKRASDEQAFTAWIGREQARIQSTASANYTALITAEADHRKTLSAHLGTVLKPESGRYISPDVSAMAQSILDKQAASAATRAAKGGINSDLLASTMANNLAIAAGLPAKRAVDLKNILSDIAKRRGESAADRAGNLLKRQQGLTDLEFQKAQARIGERQFLTKEERAAREFGIQTDLGRARIRATERGQTLAHIDREATRAAGDRRRTEDFVRKYNRTPEQWNGMSPKQQKNLRARLGLDKAGGKGGAGGLSPKDKTTNRQLWQGIESAARGAKPPSELLKPNAKGLVSWLIEKVGVPTGKSNTGEQVTRRLTIPEAEALGVKLKYGRLSPDKRKWLRQTYGIGGW